MSFLTRPAALMRSAVLRPALAATPRGHQQIRFATSDYGSGAGNPAGETPEKQGKNPSEHLEHPGPPPPKVAKGQSSSSPDEDSKSDADAKSSPASQSHSNDGASKSGKQGAQPKILNESTPAKDEQSDDVKQHNKVMEQRTEEENKQASNEDAKDEKVPKKFWAGEFSLFSTADSIANISLKAKEGVTASREAS
jgi:hypothetical protein